MLEEKIDALNRIYELYDRYTKTLTLACRKYCAHCCTCNVTLTSLEAANIFRSLSPERRAEIRRAVEPQISRKRYQPEITLNQMARCCINGEKLPDEQIDPAWGPCPLLSDHACPIYDLRPFGCRCLLSTSDCGKTGYAEVDDFTITVNYVFLQFIEHLDQPGGFGNLSDVLTILDSDLDANTPYPPQARAGNPRLIANRPIPMLLIPPEHRSGVIPLFNELNAIVRPH